MKRMVLSLLLLSTVLLAGCGGDAKRLEEVDKRSLDLKQRVESLEKQLLEAQKQLIRQQQAMQLLHSRQREMEDYFNRLQAGQGR